MIRYQATIRRKSGVQSRFRPGFLHDGVVRMTPSVFLMGVLGMTCLPLPGCRTATMQNVSQSISVTQEFQSDQILLALRLPLLS